MRTKCSNVMMGLSLSRGNIDMLLVVLGPKTDLEEKGVGAGREIAVGESYYEEYNEYIFGASS